MNNLICQSWYKHADFNYCNESNVATIEVSTLLKGGHQLPYSRVWNDSCDQGFILEHPNGKISIWTLATVDKDASSEDTYGWNFEPYLPNWTTASEKLKKMRILIIND